MHANEIKISKYEFKCVHCGAILNKGIILCPYCKTKDPSNKKKVVTGSRKKLYANKTKKTEEPRLSLVQNNRKIKRNLKKKIESLYERLIDSSFQNRT